MKNKNTIIAVVGIIVILVGAFLIFGRGNGSDNGSGRESVLEQEEVVERVDDSVIVELETGARSGEALLTVENAPAGTDSIEFELSYDAEATNEAEAALGGDTVPQGAIGSCDETGDGQWECGEPSSSGRKVVFGTCSSGVCRYHSIVGEINVLLSFEGDYGKRIFEDSYDLE